MLNHELFVNRNHAIIAFVSHDECVSGNSWKNVLNRILIKLEIIFRMFALVSVFFSSFEHF